MNDPADVRILIVARSPLARVGVGALLAQQQGISIVGESAGDQTLAAQLAALHPDVVVWSLEWEPVADQLAALGDDAPPLVALIPDERYAADAWRSGALGVLLQDLDAESLMAALNAVRLGLAVLDSSLATALFRVEAPAPAEPLTAREKDVLQLLAEGLPNKAIAARLEISEHTVKYHVNAILGKLGVQSRTEAVVRAVRLGLIVL